MVFLTVANFIRVKRMPHPDHFWRNRWVFKLAAKFYGRRRNCYSIAIRAVHRALANATKGRRVKKITMKNLWETRIDAACNEYGTNTNIFLEGLARANVVVDRKILADLAVREPKTFKCLTDIAATKVATDPPRGARLKISAPPNGVITRGML